MTRDFTFEIYEKLLEAGLKAGYEHLTVREYLQREKLPERFIIHRHDVDRKPENALEMARLEAKYDIPTTYYFRTIDKTFKSDLIREIEEFGHEIGYHYEDMDRVNGDIEAAHQSFSAELERVREIASVDTVCMHGNPLTNHDNRDMWDGSRGFEKYGLLGEAYLSVDFIDVTYFSDTGRTWKDGALKVKDHPVGKHEKHIQVSTTTELSNMIESKNLERVCLLSHPNRWAGSSIEYTKEWSKDFLTNVGKRGLQMLPK